MPAMTTSLPTAAFGRTGWDITRVGFGAWAVGGPGWNYGWGAQDDTESIAAIRTAVEHGINWVDTAAVYGYGHSEEVVREALAPFSDADRPLVFTKCGLVPGPEDPAEPYAAAHPDSIRRECEESLRRLGVETIDLYQVHFPPDDGTELADYWSTMLALRDEGKVRAVGLSNHGVRRLDAAESIGHVETLQPEFSMIARAAGDTVIPWCDAHETGVIVYSPMASGLLTGRFSAQRVAELPADDWRRQEDAFTVDLERNLALADALVPIAERHDTSVASVAIAWTLAWPGVTAAIVGARSSEQVLGWLDAASLRLTDADLSEIAAAIAATGAGEGPALPQQS
jgi:aryl-alcohol dehydrogenase-like predicted oxidoreductase